MTGRDERVPGVRDPGVIGGRIGPSEPRADFSTTIKEKL